MQDSKLGGRCVVFAGPETKKPSARAGFDLELQWRRSGYPASRASGRRAREVMPAAMRAEVRMSALAHGVCIGGNPRTRRQIGRAHVRTPVTYSHVVCRLPVEQNKTTRA